MKYRGLHCIPDVDLLRERETGIHDSIVVFHM